MDILQHSITLISIIIGIGLTEMFGNLHRLIRNRTRVKWDLLPIAWAATLLLFVINYWWGIFLRFTGETEASNAAELALILIPPMLLFLATSSALPNFEPGGEWDMRRHYDAQRKVFILTILFYQMSTWTTALMVGTFGWNSASVIRAAAFLLLVAVFLLNQRRWDWIGAVGLFLLLTTRLSTQVVQ